MARQSDRSAHLSSVVYGSGPAVRPHPYRATVIPRRLLPYRLAQYILMASESEASRVVADAVLPSLQQAADFILAHLEERPGDQLLAVDVVPDRPDVQTVPLSFDGTPSEIAVELERAVARLSEPGRRLAIPMEVLHQVERFCRSAPSLDPGDSGVAVSLRVERSGDISTSALVGRWHDAGQAENAAWALAGQVSGYTCPGADGGFQVVVHVVAAERPVRASSRDWLAAVVVA